MTTNFTILNLPAGPDCSSVKTENRRVPKLTGGMVDMLRVELAVCHFVEFTVFDAHGTTVISRHGGVFSGQFLRPDAPPLALTPAVAELGYDSLVTLWNDNEPEAL